ncbi:MAG: UDP-3-O-(3-hydroxymyristoyl)glucosamine N-acyltransferase [Deltaproteobacteria bacterium]|nr:UDP-3-O-(3-hydroxymyristoyl)glucosamine N-acyltransferase [Deltaproteobacteria bacterium]
MPRTAGPIRLAELARVLGLEVEGDPQLEIGGFASLEKAGPDELVFVRDRGHLAALAACPARAVVAPAGFALEGRSALRSARPAHDFSRLMQHFLPLPRPPAGIASGAHVDPTAEIHPTASIEAGARIGPGSRVGAGTVIAANATLAAVVVVGRDCWIHSGAVLRDRTQVGDRVVLQPGVVLGSDGFGLVADEQGRPVAMAHRGRVVVEDDVEIGANTTVDRATLDETRIRRGAKIDNLVQIAHNCDVGENALIVAQTGLSGGTIVGPGAIVMAQAGTTGHLRIGARAFVGARAGLHHDVADGERVFGSPAMEERTWHRAMAALKRLPELLRRVRRLEQRLDLRAGDASPSTGDSDRA